MHNFEHRRTSPIGAFVGTIPIATILKTEDALINVGSIDVFEGALYMQVVLTFPEGTEQPMIKIPATIRDQMLQSQDRARISSDGTHTTLESTTERDIQHDFPTEQPAHPEMRIRITDDSESWMYGMPGGMGYTGDVANGRYSFAGRFHEVTTNPRILIEPVSWRSMFEPPEYEAMPEFEPKWSIPIDLDTLVPAKEIDAR